MLSCKASTKIDANKCNAMCHAIRAAKIGNCIPPLLPYESVRQPTARATLRSPPPRYST